MPFVLFTFHPDAETAELVTEFGRTVDRFLEDGWKIEAMLPKPGDTSFGTSIGTSIVFSKPR